MSDSELLGLKISREGKNFVVNVDSCANPQNAIWKRNVSELAKDEVLLDANEANEFLKKGDQTAYEVINLWKINPQIAGITKKTGVNCDITILNYGVISTGSHGELFPTYGHDHTRRFGEVYVVLEGEANIVPYSRGKGTTTIVHLNKGEEYYIPPGWIHRTYCGREGAVLVGFVPNEAGHNYEIVKGKGFPYHLFLDQGMRQVEYVRNPKFEQTKLELIESSRESKTVSKFFGAAMELKRLLERE